VIIGEQALFQRKANKKGKTVGKPVLTGYTFEFSSPLNPASATNSVDYQLDTVTTKKVKKKLAHILHPIVNFNVSYREDAVTIAFAGKETFPTGGQITVLSGVTGVSGGAVGGTRVFTISKGGRSVTPS
jgi:hypothetical protein